MLGRLGSFAFRFRKAVLIATVAFIIIAGVFASGVAKDLSPKGFDDPGSESSKVERLLRSKFNAALENVILVFDAKPGHQIATQDVNGLKFDESIKSTAAAIDRDIRKLHGYRDSYSLWTISGTLSQNAFLCCEGSNQKALMLATISGKNDTDIPDETIVKEIKAIIQKHQSDAVTVKVGGASLIYKEFNGTIRSDLEKAELIAFPFTLLCLVLVFRSVVAAALPLFIGGLAIVGTIFVLFILTQFTTVSIFSLNLATMMGLGLAIDYSLFIVSRYREELHKGVPVEQAIITASQTAGRTVVFSGVTVAVSLAALWIFPLPFMKSFAYAGVAVVLIDIIGAIIVLPAMLGVLGKNVDKLTLWKHEPKPVGEGGWHRLAVFVMRRAAPVAVLATLLLVVLASPFLHVRFGLADQRALPKSSEARTTHAEFERFLAGQQAPVDIVMPNVPNARTEKVKKEVLAYKDRLLDAGAQAVLTPYGLYSKVSVEAGFSAYLTDSAVRVQAITLGNPLGDTAQKFVHTVRDVPAPYKALAGGASAKLVDNKKVIMERIPYAAALIILVTFVTLFMMFGSVLVPIKALVLNTLSIAAMFGIITWVFQQGHMSNWFHFTATGILDYNNPIVMFCVAFGLSMDYEVFMLSRIREEYDTGVGNEQAVANGLERSGRIVTAAAGLLAVVFIAFGTSSVSIIKMFGFGLTVAVLLDATVVRALLVPAFMKLAGRANWWAPAPMKRLYERFGVRE